MTQNKIFKYCSELPELKDHLDFLAVLLKKPERIKNNSQGFTVYLYQPEPINTINFKEKEFYPLKLSKIKNQIENIENFKVTDILRKELEEMTSLTNELLKTDNLDLSSSLFYKMEYQKLSKSFELNAFKKLLEKYTLLSEDLSKAVPSSLNKPQLIRTIKFKSDGELESDHLETERNEIKRFEIGNNIYIPIGSSSVIKVVYQGSVIGPRMGHGMQEFWKFQDKNWTCIASNQTWIS